MLVRDIMSREPITAHPSTSLSELAHLMVVNRIGCCPIVGEDGSLLGIVTEADFIGNERGLPFSAMLLPQLYEGGLAPESVESMRYRAAEEHASEIMRSPVVTAAEDEPIADLVRRMVEHGLSRFPVVRGGKLVGIVSRHDLLKVLVPEASPAAARTA